VEITHPFHPLRGRRFQILNRKHWCNDEVFTIHEAGSAPINVPREWTDLRDPEPYDIPSIVRPRIIFDALSRAAALITILGEKKPTQKKD
jgi:hypothetical protein